MTAESRADGPLRAIPANIRRAVSAVAPLRVAAASLLGAMRAERKSRDGILVLLYHDVRTGERAAFGRQLDALRGVADFVSADDAVAILSTGASGRYVCLTFDDGRSGAFETAVPLLAAQRIPATLFVVPAWIDGRASGVMSWRDCVQAAAAGMTIGSHTASHKRLSSLDEEGAAAELAHSRDAIAAALGGPCRHFACPWGQPITDFDPARDPALARAAGYRTFFTTTPTRASPGTSLWAIPRVRMEPRWGAAELRFAWTR